MLYCATNDRSGTVSYEIRPPAGKAVSLRVTLDVAAALLLARDCGRDPLAEILAYVEEHSERLERDAEQSKADRIVKTAREERDAAAARLLLAERDSRERAARIADMDSARERERRADLAALAGSLSAKLA